MELFEYIRARFLNQQNVEIDGIVDKLISLKTIK